MLSSRNGLVGVFHGGDLVLESNAPKFWKDIGKIGNTLPSVRTLVPHDARDEVMADREGDWFVLLSKPNSNLNRIGYQELKVSDVTDTNIQALIANIELAIGMIGGMLSKMNQSDSYEVKFEPPMSKRIVESEVISFHAEARLILPDDFFD